ncbi:MFS transporter, partial [bacterium AH-315-E07]|nr:MFS transporter [bacterium AH-315-E07]
MGANVPYWRLSSFYFFFFAVLGSFVPYWSLYLKELGFSAAEIGELLAIFMLMKVVSPNLWGWVADHSGRRIQLTRWLAVFATLGFCTVFIGDSYAAIVVCMMLFSLFWHAITPQFEATTLNHLGADVHRYSHIRLWGSVGFIVAVVALGPVLEKNGASWLLPVMVVLLMLTAIVGFLVPSDKGHHLPSPSHGIFKILKRPEVIGLLLASFLMQLSHGPYYTFYSIYLQTADYSRGFIGVLWGLGVLAEVALFIVVHRIFNGFSLRFLMLASLLLTSVRWILIAYFVDQVAVLIVAQLLHAASFGLYHAVAMQLIHHHFVGKHQVRGQSLYSSVSFGVGGASGSYVGGELWDSHGAAVVFSLAALAAALAFVIT